jgi:hypothetical protein
MTKRGRSPGMSLFFVFLELSGFDDEARFPYINASGRINTAFIICMYNRGLFRGDRVISQGNLLQQ